MHEVRGFYTHTDFEFTRLSKIISLAQGKASLKQISSAGGERLVVPHVVLEKKSGGDGFGIALHLPEEGYLYRQAAFSGFAVATWRGMKVAERINRVDVTTLDACLGLVQNRQNGEDLRAIERDNLATRVDGMDQMQALRREILEQAPKTQELQKILEAMLKYNVRIITGELKREVLEGRIESTPTETGEIENPSVNLPDGRKLTFTRAKFIDDGIVITTRVEESSGTIQEVDYTVQQLKEMY